MINISSPSTRSSSITVIFTVLLLLPAGIVTICVVELKSMSLSVIKQQTHHTSICDCANMHTIVANYSANHVQTTKHG